MRLPSSTTHSSRSCRIGAIASAFAIGALFAVAGVSTAGATPSEPADTGAWRVYLSLQAMDAAGNPSFARPAGTTLTITTSGSTATCTQPANVDDMVCNHPDTGFLVARGGMYHITASNLPAGWSVSNVGAFTTGLTQTGPQCTPNQAGFVNPCRHKVYAGPSAQSVEVSSTVISREQVLPMGAASEPHSSISVAMDDGETESVSSLMTDSGSATASSPAATDVEGAVIAAPVRPAAQTAGTTAASAVALPDTSNSTSILIMACGGLLLCGVAAVALVATSRPKRQLS